MPPRHFPPPWSVEELDSCFVVKDLKGQPLAYVYFEKEPRRRFRRELLARGDALRLVASLTLHLFAALAEKERAMIAARTKAALAQPVGVT